MAPQRCTALTAALLSLCLPSLSTNAAVQRYLAPQNCTSKVYHRRTDRPIEVADTSGLCPPSGGSRAYLLDPSAASGKPNLSEVKPRTNQSFTCRSDQICYISIDGFGLQQGDAIAILAEAESCGQSSKAVVYKQLVQREAEVDVLSGFDHQGQALNVKGIYAVFEIPSGTLAEGTEYRVCYASALGIKDENVVNLTAQDFFYDAGILRVTSNIYQCDFENETLNACGFSSLREHYDLDFEWKVSTGPSTTPGSGPDSDSTISLNGTGHYAVMKSPGFLTEGAAAVLVGSPLIAVKGKYCASFAYNMYGDDVNSLRVYAAPAKLGDRISHGGDDAIIENAVAEGESHFWGQPKWVGVGNKGKNWHNAGFPLQLSDDKAFRLIFEALAGRSEKGDIAVDDIVVKSGDCDANTRTMPKSLVGRREMICGEVRMTTGNHPDDKTWSLEGAISCAGRGYSVSQLEHSWMPCCVPHFGTYTLLLHDHMNDGWEGSQLEMRFFDRVVKFGSEMRKRSGEVKIPIVIGQLEINAGRYLLGAVEADVTAVHQNSLVWCGLVEAGTEGQVRQPIPHKQLIKDYGVRSREPTTSPSQKITISISGDFIMPSKNYDLYCFCEQADIDLRRAMNQTQDDPGMDDPQIAATRYRITTDSQAPEVTLKELQLQSGLVTARIQSNEHSTVWCYPFLASANKSVTSETLRTVGHVVEFSAGNTTAAFDFQNLASNAEYKLYCDAQDFAEPTPNSFTKDQIARGGIFTGDGNDTVSFHTTKRAPAASISRVSSLSSGFDVFTILDAPGRVFCAAAPEGVEFPSVQDVMKAGANATFAIQDFALDPRSEVRVAIRGVSAQTPYKVFCVGATDDGSLSTSEKTMWKNAHPVMSYGKFCDIPASPQTGQRSELATPFDPLTSDEELAVRRFILGQKSLGIESVYRVNILPNKTETYAYYKGKSSIPKRYARVRAGRCLKDNRGFYEQLKIGPLNEDDDNMKWERLGKPVETSCGGYTVEGIFGRRLGAIDEDAIQKVFKDSFGYGFATVECSQGEAACLRLGAIAVEQPNLQGRKLRDGEAEAFVWVGLKLPNGEPVPFFYKLSLAELGVASVSELDPHSLPRRLDVMDWLHTPRAVWYNGAHFANADALTKAYGSGKNIDKVTPATLNLRNDNRAKASHAKRRLLPGPFPGAAGTAGIDLDRTRRRGGLEYRSPPEHIEPEGKRFTVQSHPGGQSFSINYTGWEFTVTNDRDKSLQFWNLRFQDEQLAFQLGLQEALAHYTVSERTFFFLDSWYGGLGGAARPVLRGYECPKHGVMLFWDQSLCVWEQDMARPIRSHYRSGEIRDAAPHLALHVRQMLTVSNYDYVTTYIFHSSGHVEMKVEFTGELYAGVEVPWWSSRQIHYGTQVTGAMRFAALHAHVVVWKVDFDLGDDFTDNSVYFEEIVPDPKRHGANYIERYFASNEKEAAYGVNDSRAIAYEIVDEKRDTYGNYGGWRVLPGHSMSPNQPTAELYSGPAAWSKYKAFSTVHKYSELDATLPRDNKFAGDPAVCVDRYINDNETLRHSDVVTWMSMGFLHIPCSEDYPLTVPIGNTLSAMIRPNNWFLEDPTMDLHNAVGGDFKDPGQCAVVRRDILEVMDMSNARGPIVI